MKVIIDRDIIPFVGGCSNPYAEVLYQRGELIDARAAADCDAMLIRTRTRCDAALLDSSRVRFIATATIGYDHIDTRYCREHAIEVRRAEGCNARGVLQWVAGALAHLLAADHLTPDRCTLGIVGVGHIGSLLWSDTPATGAFGCCAAIRRATGARGRRFHSARRACRTRRHTYVPHPARRHHTPHGRRQAAVAHAPRRHYPSTPRAERWSTAVRCSHQAAVMSSTYGSTSRI